MSKNHEMMKMMQNLIKIDRKFDENLTDCKEDGLHSTQENQRIYNDFLDRAVQKQ